MKNSNKYDAVIVGGSYAGLSAAMAFGRAVRNTLVIDSGKPCNRQTPHSHNFLTQDGETPAEIARKAKAQVLEYPTVGFMEDEVTEISGENTNFTITTKSGKTIQADKVLFATGIRDIMPDIQGFAACWGISVIHCPYCHGYEYRQQKTGILINGPMAYMYAKMISNWSENLTIFTNGKPEIDAEQTAALKSKNIHVIDTEIAEIVHQDGQIESIVLKDGSKQIIRALYNRPDFVQHSLIPEKLGCAMTEQNYISVDESFQTSVKGIYAAGDNTSPKRAVSGAVYSGSMAAVFINHQLIDERF